MLLAAIACSNKSILKRKYQKGFYVSQGKKPNVPKSCSACAKVTAFYANTNGSDAQTKHVHTHVDSASKCPENSATVFLQQESHPEKKSVIVKRGPSCRSPRQKLFIITFLRKQLRRSGKKVFCFCLHSSSWSPHSRSQAISWQF